MKKNVINICSLGCGPASDIVAIINVLESEARLKDITLDIRVTVVDVDDSWKNTCLAVLHCLERFRYSSWKIKFIQTDLSQFHSVEFLEAIQKQIS
ncbi:hypothetical protein CEXT_715481 [Caerostris extrusa]|uniref:Uncharacterized protein n=1 Tax=Caerostris extrusa TaxID=172846 RepID=A0AAV4X1W4_CAEEX|nr:hypothetical protein CEXT_715481 [Caerostris extrusa]